MSRDSFFCAWCRGFPRPSLPAGRDCFLRPSLPAGFTLSPRPTSSPWAARIALVLTSLLQRLSILGLKSRIDARIAPVLAFWLHRFASLGLKSRIDARIAPDSTFWLHRFAILGLKSGITAAPSCRRVEWPACGRSLPPRCRVRFQFSSPQSRMVSPAASLWGAGGDRMPRRRHNPK